MLQTCELYGVPRASQLARAICEVTDLAATSPAMLRARASIIDTVATILAGVSAPNVRALRGALGVCSGPGEALVFGTSQRARSLDACLVNAAAYHARQAVEPRSMLGKASASGPLVSALFALGEERKATGKQVLLAYALGEELALTFSGADQRRNHSEAGQLTDGIVATLAVAGACAHLLRLDEHRTVTALLLAALLSSGMHGLSTLTRLGHCARHGMLATILVAHGFVPSADAVEGVRSVFSALESDVLFAGSATLAHGPESQEAAWESFCERAAQCLPRPQIAPLFERLETLESALDLSWVAGLAGLSPLHELRGASPEILASAPSQSVQEDTTWVP